MPLLRTVTAVEAEGGMVSPATAKAFGQTLRLSGQLVDLVAPGHLPGPEVREARRLLPSPVAQPSGNTPEDHLRKKPGREVVTDLAIVVENGLLETGGRLLPTPKAGDGDFASPMTSGRPVERSTHLGTIALLQTGNLEHRRTTPDESGRLLPTPDAYAGSRGGSQHPDKRRGGGRTVTVADVVEQELTLLPTVMANEAEKATNLQNAEQRGRTGQVYLTNVVQTVFQKTTGTPPNPHAQDALFPTPRASDHKAGGDNPTARRRVEDGTATLGERVAMMPTPRASDGEKGGPNQRGSKGDLTMPSLAPLLEAVEWGEYEPAIRRWEAIMGPAPSPVIAGAKGKPRLSPLFTEWMMGQPVGWITSPDIGLTKNEQLKACGNGVVTQQAEAALWDMLAAFESEVAA
jgi:hypothetical protein